MYGEGYPITGEILFALADVSDAQGSTDDGRRYRGRAEANRHETFLGADADASALNTHGTFLMSEGLYDEAHVYVECALNIREDKLGERHFETSTSLLKLGVLLQLRAREGEARQYLERAVAVRAEICGEDQPATELVRENLRLLDV